MASLCDRLWAYVCVYVKEFGVCGGVCVCMCVFGCFVLLCLFSWADQVLSTGSSGRLALMSAVLPMTAYRGCADISCRKQTSGMRLKALPLQLGKQINMITHLSRKEAFEGATLLEMTMTQPQSDLC